MRRDMPYRFVTAKEFAEAYQSFHVGRKLATDLATPYDKSKSHPAALTTEKYGLNKKELLKACTDREILLMKRNSFVYFFKLFQVSVKVQHLIVYSVFIKLLFKVLIMIMISVKCNSVHYYDGVLPN